jgi:sialate O-acetylesterase
MKIVVFLLFLFTIAPAESPHGVVIMPAIFSDNMVLQQKANVPFWGMAMSGTKVTVKASWGKMGRTKVKDNGTWKVRLQTLKAGGPYEVTVIVGDSVIVYRDVMLGEVWLCSGQSNMEIPLEGWPPRNLIQNSDAEIQQANYPDIRLFTVTRAVSNVPEFDCAGRWSICNSKTAAKFSAVGYFFGRKLYADLNVPIGLIFSSWGGTKIQSWISGKYLGQLDEYTPVVEKIATVGGEVQKLYDWIRSHPAVDISMKDAAHQYENLDFGDSTCSAPAFHDNAWKKISLPAYWESTEVGDFHGAVWFRKKVGIPRSWLNKRLVAEFGPIDDMDVCYVNGIRAGAMEGGGFGRTPRVYPVVKEIVSDTIVTVALRVIHNDGAGGIWGGGVKMQIHPDGSKDTAESVALSGDWKYLPVAEYMGSKFYIYKSLGEEFYSRPQSTVNIGSSSPTMLYNGMIVPLIPYYIKGVIWYQGESNSGSPNEYNNYRTLFSLMIKNWRADWNEGNFPFYYVQIAPYSYGGNAKSYMVREAQRLTLSVPQTGMAVTLDIAGTGDIHPSDKQDVGLRLALWALAKNYHENIICSGPLFKSMKIQQGKIILLFDDVGKGLVFKSSNGESNFLISGKDSMFVKANVEVDGKRLIVYNDSVKNPIAVRYAWTNAAVATLFNKEGLPASTFRTDNWSP